jgi:hypothetical protein
MYFHGRFAFTNEESRNGHEIDLFTSVPDLVSRDRDVVLVRRIFSSGKPQGVGNLE